MASVNGLQPTVIRTERGLTLGGTRLTIYTLMDHIKAGWPPKLIQDWFELTEQQMNDVLAYITVHKEEVEAEYQQVLRRNEEIEQYWREYNREHLVRIAALPSKPGQEAMKEKLKAWKKALGVAA